MQSPCQHPSRKKQTVLKAVFVFPGKESGVGQGSKLAAMKEGGRRGEGGRKQGRKEGRKGGRGGTEGRGKGSGRGGEDR